MMPQETITHRSSKRHICTATHRKEELTREVDDEVAWVLDHLLHCNASSLQRLWLDQHCLQRSVAASENANRMQQCVSVPFWRQRHSLLDVCMVSKCTNQEFAKMHILSLNALL